MDAPRYHLDQVVHGASAQREDFDGPLDLILRLLSRNRMEIGEIQISLILEQYLDWMQRRRELDLEVASEFVAMASHLVYLKTRMLLAQQDEDVRGEMEELMASLEERQRGERCAQIQAVVPELRERAALGSGYLSRGAIALEPDQTYRYRHEPEDLLRAMTALQRRSGAPPPEAAFHDIVRREPYPVADKVRELFQRLLHSGVLRLKSLLLSAHSRSELVASFLAVLELCRRRQIHLAGEGEECTVTALTQEGGGEEK